MSNLQGCYIDRRKSRRANVNACSTEESESKSVHRVNMSKVKNAKDEEPSFTDNSKIEVTKAQDYFKISECGRKFFKNLEETCARA